MTDLSGEVEDGLIDLNKEPVERKRKRVEEISSAGKGNERSNDLPKTGRVLRSRTVAMSDGEKQVIKMGIVNMEDKEDDEDEMLMVESEEEGKVQVLQKKKKKGRRGRPPKNGVKSEVSALSKPKRGRPPKNEGKCEVSAPIKMKKRKPGRPPKAESQCGVSSSSYKKKDRKVIGKKKKVDASNDGDGQCESIVKRKPGRPPKIRNEETGLVIKKKIVKKNGDHKKIENAAGPLKKLKTDASDLGNDFARREKETVELADGKEMGLREQKQLVRDQILDMLMKAGWSIEYRQRQSKDYQDAVYIDRDGRTHWSVTLAYQKLKKRIDEGKAEEKDVMAFTPIPEETLGMLFRVTEKGKKGGKKKDGAVKTVKRVKRVSSKTKPLGGEIKSKLNPRNQRSLLARKPREGPDSNNNELYEEKRSLLSWMIDLGTVPLGGKVKYKRGRGKKILIEGRIMKDGICCDCCNVTHRVSDFEAHAESKVGKLYENIYLDSGNSLRRCLVESWKKHVEIDNINFVTVDVEGDDPNDDTCNLCGDGGDLICCDSCPSTFHNGCLHIEVPSGDWHCVYCSCKFCGVTCESTDDDHDILSELFTCRLCEEKFHMHCINGDSAEDFDGEIPSFCGKECLKICEQLPALLGVRNELQEGFSYTILQHSVVSDDEFRNGDSSKLESNSKLAVAFSVMDECFEPIIDERSGTNIIHNVVYSCGSNIRRLNYDGFCTIILEKGDEFVAAASIRIHGSQLAEMPFIGTRFMYRRQGMCSRLLTAVETVLRSLGVKKLVIPAISQLNETWTKVFGFVPVEESERQEMKYMSMIVFPGVNMLQKPIIGIEQKIDSAAVEPTEVIPEHQNNMQENPASDSNNDKNTDVESDAVMPAGSLNKETIEIDAVVAGADNGDCTDHLDESKDNSVSLNTNASIDCNMEPQESAEE
ncbi:hypothetical protein ABFX02_03G101800 [Erythranthe guttata]